MAATMKTASVGLLSRQARIIAIPLARPRARPVVGHNSQNLTSSSHKVLTYYQFQLSRPKKLQPAAAEGNGVQTTEKPKAGWLPEEGVAAWAQGKAAQLWASFGKAKGGWKLKVFQTGERLMDRLDFEELALKSIDPSMAPSIAHPTRNVMNSQSEKAGGSADVVPLKIPLLYPSSVTASAEAVIAQLKRDTAHRTPTHRRGFYMWLVIAPFTAPFMIVPIIPNLPFFFCVWRSWSHYKAFRSSQYLQSLLDKDVIVPEASEILDSVYSVPNAPSTEANESHELLLTKSAVPAIVEEFQLHENTTADLYRAVEQARLRVKNGSV